MQSNTEQEAELLLIKMQSNSNILQDADDFIHSETRITLLLFHDNEDYYSKTVTFE